MAGALAAAASALTARSVSANGTIGGGQNTSGASDDDTIGKISESEFERLNKEGAAAVAAVTPTKEPLSAADQKLMMEVAMGGMMQLEVSRVAAQKASTEDGRLMAEAEVEEQTGLSAKLKEIASAKGATLPAGPDAKTKQLLAKMQNLSGAEFDRTYLRESGVKGHEMLDKTMGRVESRAADPSLKALAAAAHPLVRTHLQVSRDELSGAGGNGRAKTTT